MAALSAALIAELDEAVDGRSPERRADILRQVTSLFLSDAHRLSESQIGVFDDVLIRLIERADAPTLVLLSNQVRSRTMSEMLSAQSASG